jgi:hypothetical protein
MQPFFPARDRPILGGNLHAREFRLGETLAKVAVERLWSVAAESPQASLPNPINSRFVGNFYLNGIA